MQLLPDKCVWFCEFCYFPCSSTQHLKNPLNTNSNFPNPSELNYISIDLINLLKLQWQQENFFSFIHPHAN